MPKSHSSNDLMRASRVFSERSKNPWFQIVQAAVEPAQRVGGNAGKEEAEHEAEDRVLFRQGRKQLRVGGLCQADLLHTCNREIRFELVDLGAQRRRLQR